MDLEREKLYAYDEGARQKALDAARNLLRMNVGTVEQIASAEGLTIEEVTALKKEIGL